MENTTRSPESWKEIIEKCLRECKASGKSKCQWLKENQIKRTSFFKYQREFAAGIAETEAVEIPMMPVSNNCPVMITITSGKVMIEATELSENLAECIGRIVRYAL